MPEIYVSTDIEADGPIPGENSMLSLASAAYNKKRELVSTFSVNLVCLADATPDKSTMQWWKTQQPAWEACRTNPIAPNIAMANYVNWLDALAGKPVFVGYPAAYDFMFVYWYLMKFVGRSPFSHSALDLKSLAMVALNKGFHQAHKQNMPKKWFANKPHTHQALDDAIEQASLFFSLVDELELKL